MTRTCPYCLSSEIDDDPARGDATCMICGIVLEESQIVSDVQFQEIGGRIQASGQFVNTSAFVGNGEPGQPKPESREQTYYKGKKLIQEIGSQLRINNHCMDVAHNFYKMAVNQNITRGRNRIYVITACLYMTCRLEGTSHLLLDFSDVTQVNVFDLGRTLNFLTRTLKINLPTTDPCLYIVRFAVMLELGDKVDRIASLATRIVQRMKLDWMATGRRPTGLCGAALLLAARAFDVNRAVADIVNIVHISETVIRKRLDEFANTPSGNLTIDEFKVVDLEECEDPPAYQKALTQRAKENKRQEEIQAEKIVNEFGTVQEEFEVAIKDKMKRSSYGATLTGQDTDETTPEIQEEREAVQPELIDEIYDYEKSNEQLVTEDRKFTEFQQKASKFGPTLDSLGIKSGDQQPSIQESESIELDLGDIDDKEIDAYLLNESEAKMKEGLWMQRNGAHMAEVEKKRKAKEEEEAKERENPTKKKRRAPAKRLPINSKDYNDALYQVIQEKRLSNKINYDVLKDLGGEVIFAEPEPEKPIQGDIQIVDVTQPDTTQSFNTSMQPSFEKDIQLDTQPPETLTPVAQKPKAAPQRYKRKTVMPTAIKRKTG
jgi:transcription factor IIIB subunit 2